MTDVQPLAASASSQHAVSPQGGARAEPSAPRTRLVLRLAGEICTKSPRTRRRYLRTLCDNARVALRAARVDASVHHEWNQLVADVADAAAARDALAHVFGVHIVDEVREVAFGSLDELVDGLATLFAPRISGRTFGVRPRRHGETGFRSMDLARALGTALVERGGRVHLDSPDVAVDVDARPGAAVAVVERIAGPGGLPLGTGGRALALFSGGFDSPVAAWRMMRRGVVLDLAVFDLGAAGQVDQALSVARRLMSRWAAGRAVQVHVVDLAAVVTHLREHAEPRLSQLLLKRAMYRTGSALTQALRLEAMVTGESLGQVSTQTLRNLAVCERVSAVPVLRPLIGVNKEEIIAAARTIGTHDDSALTQEICQITTGQVETWGDPVKVEAAEHAVGLDHVGDAAIAAAVLGRRVVDLRRWDGPATPSVVVDAVVPGAVVVDVRELNEGPTAGDLRLPTSVALDRAGELDPAATYVLVCARGERSTRLAEAFTARGLHAYSLRGGVRRLRRAAVR